MKWMPSLTPKTQEQSKPGHEHVAAKTDRLFRMIRILDKRFHDHCDSDVEFYHYLVDKFATTMQFYEWACECDVKELEAEHLMFKMLALEAMGR